MEGFVGGAVLKQRLHALHLELHFEIGGKSCHHFFHGAGDLPGVQGGSDGGKKVGVVKVYDVLPVQLQRADKGSLQLRQEVERTAQERHMSPDGFAAGQAGDSLIDHRLKDGGSQIFLCGAFIDQRLNVRLCKHSASGGNGIEGLIIFCIFVEAGGIGLNQGGHLVDEGACAPGADPVHALLHVTAFEIDDFCVLAAQLDGHIRHGGKLL